jgi:hypothetical protein
MKGMLKSSKRYISRYPTKQQLYVLFKLLIGRESFTYGLRDHIYHSFKWVLGCCTRWTKQLSENGKLLDKGKKKLSNDLDVGRLINIVHNHDVFM